jgi:hypothetical protein
MFENQGINNGYKLSNDRIDGINPFVHYPFILAYDQYFVAICGFNLKI